MIGRTSRSLSVGMLRLPNYGKEWYIRSPHASASRPGPQCLLKGEPAPFAGSVHLERTGVVLGRPRLISSIPIQHGRAMAPEANEMLSLHEGIEVDVIIEGRPLNGDRCANTALTWRKPPALACELWGMLSAKGICASKGTTTSSLA